MLLSRSAKPEASRQAMRWKLSSIGKPCPMERPISVPGTLYNWLKRPPIDPPPSQAKSASRPDPIRERENVRQRIFESFTAAIVERFKRPLLESEQLERDRGVDEAMKRYDSKQLERTAQVGNSLTREANATSQH